MTKGGKAGMKEKSLNERVEKFNNYILSDIRPRIKASPQIEDVVVWVKDFDEETGTLVLGLALGDGVGCSPFCGCAANQIAQLIANELAYEFPEIKRVVGLAEIPPDDFLKLWNEN
jgi:Fe-S cluster biogenesis protein NfuA